MKTIVQTLLLFLVFSCNETVSKTQQPIPAIQKGVVLKVLGTVQDAGSPHIACKKECCATLFRTGNTSRKIVSLGIVDYDNQATYLFEATPDITEQVKSLTKELSGIPNELPNGVFLTHAHIGHYTGLMFFGKEATNAKAIPTYVMPKMKRYLEENGPWGQLVTEGNIALNVLENKKEVSLSEKLKVLPFTVPHRDEYSETVGYTIIGPNKRVLFIPDIDKWERWDTSIRQAIAAVDYAFIDATFFDGEELNSRDISQIPHPFVTESMALFDDLSAVEKAKIHFIHFNHTNPLLNSDSPQSTNVLKNGYVVARKGQLFAL